MMKRRARRRHSYIEAFSKKKEPECGPSTPLLFRWGDLNNKSEREGNEYKDEIWVKSFEVVIAIANNTPPACSAKWNLWHFQR